MSWNAVKNGQGCQKCGQIKVANIRRNSYEYIKSQFQKYGLTLISKEYKNNEQKLKYICNKHLEKGIQEITYASLISSKGCFYCGKERTIESLTKSHNQFEKEVKKIHGKKYELIEKYTKSKKKIAVYCNECNKIFKIRASHLLDGHGCSFCSSSRGEKVIQRFLDVHKIKNISQKKFEGCKHKRHLSFDFYLPDYNMTVEYHGIQHYQPVEIFGGEKAFKKQKEHDEIKKKYCKDNNIKYIEISYKDYKNINKILSSLLLREVVKLWEK